ncbi:DUF406 domain-containing protein [Edwardsiella ictaluri]|uniref:DUF406 domain-containing protein n=1 Tax=Edwardsiella ictaluri TaxID=67780 RepID=UPI0037832295
MKEVVDKCSNKGCTIDIGSVLDNDNCTTIITQAYPSRDEAEKQLAKLTAKSQRVAQQEYPCIITHDICEKEGEFILNVHFNFSCQAETVIFELSLRHA